VYHQQLGRFYSDWHQHPWGQLLYAQQGPVHLNVAGKKFLLPNWYGAWIPPDTFHQIWSDSDTLHLRSVCFAPISEQETWSRQLCVFPLSDLVKEMICYSEKWNQLTQQDSKESTFLAALLDLLPGEMQKAVDVWLPSTSHEKLSALLEYLQEHLQEKITVTFLAHRFGLSTRSLTRLFREQLGVSFAGYCKIARILKALELIQAGSDNVSQLAIAVGYESMATFSNNFLNICGNRPQHFVRQKKVRL
jgi:AraC-like DNA-binding protein